MSKKLIIALDFPTEEQALTLLNEVNPQLCALKVGSEMFTRFGCSFIEKLVNKGYRVFLDLKFHDIPNTVAQSCRAAADLGVWMINVHAMGGLKMLQAASAVLQDYGQQRPLLIAVTGLTSMTDEDLSEIGITTSIELHVQKLASLAKQAGLDGVVCSAYEVPGIKVACGKQFLTVTPGIRLAEDPSHDQARIVTPTQALNLGSDYLVIGRSITHSSQPTQVIARIIANMTASSVE